MEESRRAVFDRQKTPLERLVALMALLRSPEGCAWDRKQTHRTLLPYLIEETYEFIEAVESDDSQAMCEELGDLFCQIVFHAQVASEAGEFGLDDAIEKILAKLIERHPHVFEQENQLTPGQVRNQWEKIKISSGEKPSVLAGVPKAMPALTMAFRIGEKAAGIGFDWKEASEVIEKLREETDEIAAALNDGDREEVSNEIGDLLFAVTSLARKVEVDPESALRHSLEKFKKRFAELEKKVSESNRQFQDLTLEQLEEMWQSIK